MDNQPQLAKQIQERNLNARFTFGSIHLEKNKQEQSSPKQIIGSHIAKVNKQQTHSAPIMNGASNSQFAGQIADYLLELQSKWIQKETQIKDYVEGLKKTIEQKDLRIEKLHIENYKLSTQLTQIGKQKHQILQKLNQIHNIMISLENQKLNSDSERNSYQTIQRSQSNQMISQILKLAKQKDSKQIYSQLPPQPKLSQRKSQEENNQKDAKLMEKRILSNLIKLCQENINLYPALGSDQSSQNNDRYAFARKGKEVRATMATNDTYGSNPKRSSVNNGFNSSNHSQKLNPSTETKKQVSCYKSAKTITFNKDEEGDDQNSVSKERFYSHNVIEVNPKMDQEEDTSQHKQSEYLNQRKSLEMREQKTISLKRSLGSLKIQSRTLNQSHEISQFKKEKRKSKDRKITNNLNFSLSSSLVSASSHNQMEFEIHHQQLKQTFETVHNQPFIENYNSIAQSKLSDPDNSVNNKNSQLQPSSKSITQKAPIDLPNKHIFEYHPNNLLPFEDTKISSKFNQQQTSTRKPNQNNKLSNPEASPPLKKPSLLINNAFTFQNSPIQNTSFLQNTSEKPNQNLSRKSLTIQRQNSITFDHTHQKQSSFAPNQIDSFQTEVKNHQNHHFQSNLSVPNEKTHLLLTNIGPQTKCSSFQQKSHGNSFYFTKSNSSDDPFKKLKIQSQNSQNYQSNKSSKLNFENQMLKSYNKVLEKQTKKLSQTEKLIEKFNSQNVSILNKIHKKSIS